MLIELRIENLAVIERLSIRPQPGLNVLTGETGAGKSIIVGALSLLLGERASTESVRAGASRAVVEAVFDIEAVPAVRAQVEDRGIAVEDGLVILRREIAVEGRSRAWVNGSASTVSFIGEIGRVLVDLHGQHDHQSLLHASAQREILDDFAGSAESAEAVRVAHGRVRELVGRIEELEAGKRTTEERLELLRYQVDEIERTEPRPGEDAELAAETKRLEHSAELARLTTELHDGLYAAEDAVAARLDQMRRQLKNLIRFDPSLEDAMGALADAFHNVQEIGRQMGEYAGRIDDDPARLERALRRQDALFRLMAKYGPTIDDVIETGRRARGELEGLDDVEFSRKALERELVVAQSEFERCCSELTRLRTDAAGRLDDELNGLLPDLGMPGARFVTCLTPVLPAVAAGGETIELRVSVNAGFEPGPLARVASGGELSRIMLALKAVLAHQDRVPTLVFDEIDVGIGGRTAHRVADRLHEVARHHQVFVITHLAQIASRADFHLLVEKDDDGGVASAIASALDGEARIREVARLLGGDPESRTSMAHARELVEAANSQVGPDVADTAGPDARIAART